MVKMYAFSITLEEVCYILCTFIIVMKNSQSLATVFKEMYNGWPESWYIC